MTDTQDDKGPDEKTGNIEDAAAAYFETMGRMAAQSRALMQQWLAPFAQGSGTASNGAEGLADPTSLTEALSRATTDPNRVAAAQMTLWQGYQQLWLDVTRRLMGGEGTAEPVIEPAPGDRRFRDPDWSENPLFDFIKQSYLLNAQWLSETMKAVQGLDDDTAQKVDFYTRQMIDAFSPSNFPMTNPEVLRATAEAKGENLMRGFRNMMEDAKRGDGHPTIRQTDMEAFTVGENIAVSEGGVVFQNELFQLIQYAPLTEQVYTRPLLIIPPWINKFYILDLQPENSFVRWLGEQGYTVFLISWVNPDASLRDKGFDDYMTEGVLAAVDAVEQATGVTEMTAIGYCIGGTLLAAMLAWMAAKGDGRIKAATFLAAQVDFSEAGELRVFTDQSQLAKIEAMVEKEGYLDGKAMAWTFNMLRANDLIWSFVINNYLLGREPPAFDLLFWNADSTRLPARMLMFYLRKMYLENKLAEPGGIELRGVPIDLTTVKTPVFFQATREDHIAPYRSVFKAMKLFAGPRLFALAGSGHIAGIVNHPSRQKYQFWTNEHHKQYDDALSWLADATEHPGSWWPYWHKWNARRSGKKIAARIPGDGKLPVIEPAPGSYVKVKS